MECSKYFYFFKITIHSHFHIVCLTETKLQTRFKYCDINKPRGFSLSYHIAHLLSQFKAEHASYLLKNVKLIYWLNMVKYYISNDDPCYIFYLSCMFTIIYAKSNDMMIEISNWSEMFFFDTSQNISSIYRFVLNILCCILSVSQSK